MDIQTILSFRTGRLTWAAVVACVLATSAMAQTPAPLQSIDQVDVARYLGTWFEIAKYPNRFQRQCVADTRAEYARGPEGTVQVTNRCRLASGALTQAVGQARQVGGPSSPRLQVRFAPAWLSWLPFVWGDYWIIDLDPDYQLAAVSEPTREYLWVLSRTATVEPARYQALLQRLTAQGLDVSKLEPSPQRDATPP